MVLRNEPRGAGKELTDKAASAITATGPKMLAPLPPHETCGQLGCGAARRLRVCLDSLEALPVGVTVR